MAAQCKQCGKSLANTRAGSFTSYLFQQNYCQCNNNKPLGADKAAAQRKSAGKGSAARRQEQSISEVCTRCDKSVAKRRAGSFTSFLFQELRCQCAQPSLPKKERLARTNTQVRRQAMAAKRGYTAKFKANDEAGRNLPQVNFSADTLIGGAFRIISTIGEGGMGIVYLAQHLSLNRSYALKVLSPSIVSEQSWLRFKAEAKTLAALNHTGLVRVYDLGIHENTVPYYSMDYLDGETLEELLVRKGAQTLEYTISIFLSVLDTLAYAHRNNVVHRDIKPANIFICKSQEIKILDFGISKLVGEKRNQELTAIGEVFGTPFYMSPEQCRGEQIDLRSDIYSIGCSLFETLTGYVPYESANSFEIAMLHEEGEIPLLSDVCEISLPPSLDVVIAKCLAKLPQDRYQSAKEMAIDLTRIKEGKNLESYAAVVSNRNSDFADEHADSRSGRLVAYSLFAIFGLCLSCALALYVYSSSSLLTGRRREAIWSQESFSKEYKATGYFDERNQVMPSVSSSFDTLPISASTSNTESLVKTYLKSAPKYYSEVVTINGKKRRRFNFPTAFSLGIVRMIADSGASQAFEARGLHVIPSECKLEFISDSVPETYPELIDRFRSDDLARLCLNFNTENSNSTWSSLSRLKSLQALNLSAVRLDAHSLECLERLPALRSLGLSKCRIDTSIANSSVSLSKLRSLELAGNESVSTLHTLLLRRLTLKALSVQATKLSRADFAAISSVHSLEYLRLDGMRLKNDELSMLASLSNLKALVIAYADLEGNLTDSLCKFKSLEEVMLPSGVKFTKSEQRKLRQALPHLRPLSRFGSDTFLMTD